MPRKTERPLARAQRLAQLIATDLRGADALVDILDGDGEHDAAISMREATMYLGLASTALNSSVGCLPSLGSGRQKKAK